MMDETLTASAGEPTVGRWAKPEKTPEDLAAIALLDRLRTGDGEPMPKELPLACIVRIVAYEELPKAGEKYAMATVEGPGGRTWRLCIRRYYLDRGMRALFISHDAALPVEARYRNPDVGSVLERVFRFGFGVKVRRLLPHVKRNIYINNCGVLYPLDDFPEIKRLRTGSACNTTLHLDALDELKILVSAPRPRKNQTFLPASDSAMRVYERLRLRHLGEGQGKED